MSKKLCPYPALTGPGINYTAVAFYALRRLPRDLRAMLQERGAWEDIVRWAGVAAVEGWRNGWDFKTTYNAAQRYIYHALRAEGFQRLPRRYDKRMMYVRWEVKLNLEEE